MPTLISDLALILILAGLVTLIFKRLKQPLVLGYIVAGFLASSHMPYTPSVTDTGSISTWANIGVIFLMFTLGLEFSFKKVVKMGLGPVIAACSIIVCMMGLGSLSGHIFGWGHMNSLFLGGMLAMSSTTIIYKALDDLELRQHKFAGEVLSVLILEDILGIFLMVVLSALAVSRQFEGMELVNSLFKLGFFLILWFVVGLYMIPIFFNKVHRWLNRETLLIVSMALCFFLVVMAENAGYSAAFGAFMMGSILAETVEAESIARVVAPVKNLFGAIFFVSVGMLVDPAVLVEYGVPILVLCLVIILGQSILGTASFLLSGQPLRIAIQCGFSMAQIGEFAFIIASLGMSLHVTDDFLYPVVVAVSIITTFFTPYMIRATEPVCALANRVVPANVLKRLKERGDRIHEEQGNENMWKKLLIALINQVAAYLTLSIAVILIALASVVPILRGSMGHTAGSIVSAVLILVAASPFLRAIVMRKNHSDEWKRLHKKGRLHRIGLCVTFFFRFCIASATVFYVIHFISPFYVPLQIGVSTLLVYVMMKSRLVKWVSIKLERTFLQNLRSREVMARGNENRPGFAGRLTSRNIHIAELEVPDNSNWAGKKLHQLQFSHQDGVMIAAIVRDDYRLNAPGGEAMLFPGDRIEVIGDDNSLQTFVRRMNEDCRKLPLDSNNLQLRRLLIRDGSFLIGLSLQESGIRSEYRCMVVGFEDDEGNIIPATAHRTIQRGDSMWLVGEDEALRRLMKRN